MGQVFRHAEQYIDQLLVGAFVEIGTSRNGDDGSTKTIASWANRAGKRLTTIDVDPVNCEFVQNMHIPNVEVVNSTGEDWLKKFPSHTSYIGFLYLDNFDWDWHPEKTEDFVREQQVRYQDLGLEMNNVNSQCAHLAQAMLAMPAMAEQSIIVCDDTWYNKYWGHYSGKSGAAIPFLLNNGYEILYTEEHPEYGTILGRNINMVK